MVTGRHTRVARRHLFASLTALSALMAGALPACDDESSATATEAAETTEATANFPVVVEPAPAALTALVPDITERYQASLTQIAQQLDANYTVPTPLTLGTANCGVPNALYNPQNHSAVVCWELMQVVIQQMQANGALATPEQAAEALQNAWGVWAFFLFHEVGHAFIHMHALPSTGREEDAVDQLSTLLLLGSGPEGKHAVLSAAVTMTAFETILSQTPAWDTHSLGTQRMTNLVCWTYGSNPAEGTDIVDVEIPGAGAVLPGERAQGCQQEYDRMNRAWDTLLAPHRH
jgi:hypothetical protein